ncbi:failed axon connections homolog [Haliotis asinina]|uniref:failed axon connections homolog n=1 Tax=Haliotis asinina TaxID=109174 RepID=UPI0035325622
MDSIMDTFNNMDTLQKVLCVVGGGAVVIVSVVGLRKLCFNGKKKAKKDYPRDTVIFHQIGRGPYAPSMTPFAVKLETYLRMARISYLNVHGRQRSSKGKFPWIEYNGQEVADSSLCIEFLNKKMGVDLNRNLSPADKGVAQAMQAMVEDHLYWFLILFRWQYDNDKSLMLNAFKIGKFMLWMMQRHYKKHAWSQGLGRHTEEEATDMFKKDLQSLSDFIGTKKFLMGDEPCETDCAVFGHLSQVYWQFMGTGYVNILKDKYPNLAGYCERMKETFWPDWDQCTTQGGTKAAVK